MPAGNPQLRAQDSVPARLCGTEGRTVKSTRDGKEETVGGGARTRMSTRARIGARTGAEAGAETRIESRVEGRESPGTYEVVKQVGRKTRERGDVNL